MKRNILPIHRFNHRLTIHDPPSTRDRRLFWYKIIKLFLTHPTSEPNYSSSPTLSLPQAPINLPSCLPDLWIYTFQTSGRVQGYFLSIQQACTMTSDENNAACSSEDSHKVYPCCCCSCTWGVELGQCLRAQSITSRKSFCSVLDLRKRSRLNKIEFFGPRLLIEQRSWASPTVAATIADIDPRRSRTKCRQR